MPHTLSFMTGESFEGPTEFEANVAYPPQLCPMCGQALSVDVLEGEKLSLTFRCPDHGEVGVLGVTDVLDQQHSDEA